MGRTKEEKREYAIHMKRQRLTEAVQRLASSEGFREFVRSRRMFHHYSLHNQLLIALQSPGSMMVAGNTKWKALGYSVRKDEWKQAIWIMAPVTVKDPENPKQRKMIGTKSVRVFSRDQVEAGPDAKNIDPPISPAPIEGDSMRDELRQLEIAANWLIPNIHLTEHEMYDPDRAGVLGYYLNNGTSKRIWIRPEQSVNSKLRTLLHELAHALRDDSDGKRLTTAQEECVVDVAACLAASELGLDVENSTIPYVATWAADAPIDALETLLPLADAIAKTLTEATSEQSPER
jgi:hypothetical protein